MDMLRAIAEDIWQLVAQSRMNNLTHNFEGHLRQNIHLSLIINCDHRDHCDHRQCMASSSPVEKITEACTTPYVAVRKHVTDQKFSSVVILGGFLVGYMFSYCNVWRCTCFCDFLAHTPYSIHTARLLPINMPRHADCNLCLENFTFEQFGLPCPACAALGEPNNICGTHPPRPTAPIVSTAAGIQ